MANCLLIHSGVPLSMWHFAVNHANWILNCLPKRALGMQTPADLLGIDTNIGNIHPL
ncbi:hypothetical protein GGI13_008258, partial [Coemansia sp. RSA 455]